jgi:hypothetical protein
MKKLLYGHEGEDRDRGILSPADREFLLTGGDNLSSDQSRRNARRRIRDRIRNAIIDFDIITRLLNEDDKRMVFDEEGEWRPAFTSGQKAMIEFLYSSLADVENDDAADFETLLKSGVHDAELSRHDGPVLVNVEFDVQTDVQFDIENARERFEQGESMTIAEIGALMATGEVKGEELEELAEIARERGVVESSISPMQMDSPWGFQATDENVSLPSGLAGEDVIQDLFMRGESLMMLKAYHPDYGNEDSDGTAGSDEQPEEDDSEA